MTVTDLTTDQLKTSLDFVKHRNELEKASRIMELSGQAYRKYARKHLDAENARLLEFSRVQAKAEHQAEIAYMAYLRLSKIYRNILFKLITK